MTRQFSEPSEVIRSSYDPTTENMMPNSIGDYPGGKRIVTVQHVLCVFQSADGVLGIGGVIEGFEKTSRHGIAHDIVIPSDEECLIKGYVIENPWSEPRGYDVCFQTPILV